MKEATAIGMRRSKGRLVETQETRPKNISKEALVGDTGDKADGTLVDLG